MTPNRRLLRSEATALQLNALSNSQLEAFNKLAGLLDEALTNSTKRNGAKNLCRLAFVSGAKGTGKSSLIYTLKEMQEHDGAFRINKQITKSEIEFNRADEEDKKLIKKKIDLLGASKVFFNTKEDRKMDIHWLERLSMDPFPSGTNLLAAVLARIEYAITGERGRNKTRYGALDPHGHLGNATKQLGNLKTEAVKALEGNLEARAPGMDPTNFAIAATEAELSKIHLRDKLDEVLDNIFKSYAESDGADNEHVPGMFVMFIDDLDLRPSKAVEVLKMAHMLSSRRLFYVFVGSIEDLDDVLFFKVQGEFKELLGVDTRRTELRKIEADANEIASSLIRKLIPAHQRIEVSDMTVPEALAYDCDAGLSDSDVAERNTLEKAVIGVPEFPSRLVGSVSPQKVGSEERTAFTPLGEFRLIDLLDKHEGHCKSQEHEVIYDGANVLKSTPRHIGDAFHSLQSTGNGERGNGSSSSNKKRDEAAQEVVKWIYQMFTGHVDEDGQLTVPVQERLRKCVEQHEIWELTPPPMRVLAIPGDSEELHPFEWRNASRLSPLDLGFEIRRVLRLSIEVKKNREDKADPEAKEDEYAVLGSRSRSAFKLLHDFMLFSGAGVVTKGLRHEDLDRMACAHWKTGYSQDLRIAWSTHPWQTFWRFDIFRDLWNHIFEEIREELNDRAPMGRTEMSAFLGLSWIAATLITLDAQPGDLGMFDCQDEHDLSELQKRGKAILPTELLYKLVAAAKEVDAGGEAKAEPETPTSVFTAALNKTIDSAFDVLIERVKARRFDGHSQAIQAKVVEWILLCMPEAGISMFFSNPIADGRERRPYEPMEMEKAFLKVADHIASKMLDINKGDASPESCLFEDIMREVRNKRIERLKDFLGTHFGLGLLTCNTTILRSKEKAGAFEVGEHEDAVFNLGDKKQANFFNEVAGKDAPNLNKLLVSALPSHSHVKSVFLQLDPTALGNKVEFDELKEKICPPPPPHKKEETVLPENENDVLQAKEETVSPEKEKSTPEPRQDG